MPAWISLGGGCRVAYQLRRRRLRAESMPFDWIRTPFASVVELIDGDFAGFLRAEDLRLHEGPPRVLRDRRLGIVLPHDVDVFTAEGAEGLRARFQPRIDAFRRALATRRHVVFVRRNLGGAEAEQLLAVMRARRPELRVTVVAVDDRPDAPRSIGRHGDLLRVSAPGRANGWSGCDVAWDWILDAALHHVLQATPRTSLPWLLLGRDWLQAETALAQLLGEKGATLRRIPPVLVEALVAAEDHRFYRHRGVDLRATLRAAVGVALRRPLGGGSTIEQQLYRTLTNRRERTLSRKLREMLGAYLLGRLVDKRTLAAAYLSVAYFGARMNGVEQACARAGLSLPDMTAAEAAAIAARLKYPEPRAMSASRRRLLERRTEWVHTRMRELRS